jgi:hypothetical protein
MNAHECLLYKGLLNLQGIPLTRVNIRTSSVKGMLISTQLPACGKP